MNCVLFPISSALAGWWLRRSWLPWSHWGVVPVDFAGSPTLLCPGAVVARDQLLLCIPTHGLPGCGMRLEHLRGLGRSPPQSCPCPASSAASLTLVSKVSNNHALLLSCQCYRACVLYPALGESEETV